MEQLLLKLTKFPRFCTWGKFVVWVIGITLMLPITPILHLNRAETTETGKPYSAIAQRKVLDFTKAKLDTARSLGDKYGVRLYFIDRLAIEKLRTELRAQFNCSLSSGPSVDRINDLCNLTYANRVQGENSDAWVAWYHREFYWWHLKTYRTEPSDSTYRSYAYPAERSDTEDISEVGFGFAGWAIETYVIGIFFAALLYLLRFGEDGNEKNLRELTGHTGSFALACIFWPAYFFRYPFAYLREFAVAFTEQRYRDGVWESITQTNRQEYREIARTKHGYNEWKEKLQERPQPRWGFALALVATILLLATPALGKNVGEPPQRVTVTSRGDPTVHPPGKYVCVPFAKCPPALVENACLAPQQSTIEVLLERAWTTFEQYAERIPSGWHAVPEKVPLSFARPRCLA